MWLNTIFIATIFFILGQIFLRKSFEYNTDKDMFLIITILFSLSIGIMSVLTTLFLLYSKKLNSINIINNMSIRYSIIAGVLFFLGFIYWIRTIGTKESLGMIRITMAGFETILLYLVSYMFFNDIITIKQFIGSILILLGIFVSTI